MSVGGHILKPGDYVAWDEHNRERSGTFYGKIIKCINDSMLSFHVYEIERFSGDNIDDLLRKNYPNLSIVESNRLLSNHINMEETKRINTRFKNIDSILEDVL